jgi:hypothetical protein
MFLYPPRRSDTVAGMKPTAVNALLAPAVPLYGHPGDCGLLLLYVAPFGWGRT